MLKSTITIILTVLLIIGVAFISFSYGMNKGYQLGAFSVKNQISKYVFASSVQNITFLMYSLEKGGSKEAYKNGTDVLKRELEQYLLVDEIEKKADAFNLFFNKDSENIKDLLFYNNLSSTQDYIRYKYTKEEINNIKVFKKLLSIKY